MSTSTPSPASSPAVAPKGDKKKYPVNLPKTSFEMRANLVANEPKSMARWEAMGLYSKIRQARAGAEPFVFHDGPPYANGNIHMGHLLNKVLKDLVVRTQLGLGKDVAFTPGWDCHGLPIEHRVVKDLGAKAAELPPIEIRRLCQAYAAKHVELQKTQMKRLLTLADYDHPYLTMDARFERGTIEVFAAMIARGLVFRQKKPVHWSIENRTALAVAELEYIDREDTSIYVRFDFADRSVYEEFGLVERADKPCLMIWTTTPWTLPANLGVAVHPSHVYCLVELDGRATVLAEELLPKVCAQRGLPVPPILGRTEGFNLKGFRYTHPFVTGCPADCSEHGASIENVYTVMLADYVTLEDGTGIVHTAPGHGTEDYQTGLREKLPVYCPVKENGCFDDTVPDWLRGVHVWKANPQVVESLRASGHLYHSNKFKHSYPHDWRGKTPVIFRATAQWFIAVDQAFPGHPEGLRRATLDETQDIRFIPDWGRNRMRGMLESRPDWCVSRQRSWGLPIPAFYNEQGEALLTAASARAVAAAFGRLGSDAWFTHSPAELLGDWDAACDPDAPDWAKKPGAIGGLKAGKDTFDVWFESGSSWNAVLCEGWKDRQAGPFPADLYLEGSDQHRGWFQHSLLPAVAIHGRSPFKSVLTHGFMVDKNGHKMSKSDGNAIEVEELLKKFGADVCRWWVASIVPENDIKVDLSFIETGGEEYRKVRNTLRYLLSVLDGWNEAHRYAWQKVDESSLDAWILSRYVALVDDVRAAYAEYRFRDAVRAIFSFCNDDLSAVYLAAIKDRLYCDSTTSPRRHRTQDACRRIAEGLTRLLAPICPHTSDEAWQVLGPLLGETGDRLCVHLLTLPKGNCCRLIKDGLHPDWAKVMTLLPEWTKAIEASKKDLGVENPLDLGLAVPRPLDVDLTAFDVRDLADLCGVSRFAIGDGLVGAMRVTAEGDGQFSGEMPAIVVQDLRGEPRCDRSWKRDGTVKQRADGGWLSDRDAAALATV